MPGIDSSEVNHMKNTKTAAGITAAVCMLMLILDGKTALTGARDGVELCTKTLIPSLFPYLVLSGLLTGSLAGRPLPFLRPIGRLTGIPAGAESLLAAGLLGGYPSGALNVSLLYRKGQLSKPDAQRLLPLCNNAGPAFLFGILSPMFSDQKVAWLLWVIHILSAVLVGMVTADRPSNAALGLSREITLTESLEHAVRVMGTICGWVVLFRIMIAFLERWFLWLFPTEVQAFLCGILELSNGCVRLETVSREGLRFIIAGTLLSLGGICVTMQTASAASGLSLRIYCPAKLLQSCFSFMMCVSIQGVFSDRWRCPPLFLAGICTGSLFLGLHLKRNKKISSIPAFVGV